MISFLTGSHGYGEPKPTSDIDLVVMMDFDEAEQLASLSDPTGDESREYPTAPGDSFSLRFGKLNLIVCTEQESFAQWQTGTGYLKRQLVTPTREQAVSVFKHLFHGKPLGAT